MRALTFEDSRVQLKDLPRPEPGPGQTLLKMRLAGICNTDLEITKGYMGFQGTLGHEFVGEREDGKRFVADINFACDSCSEPHHCEHRTVLGIQNQPGAFSEWVLVPTKNLVEVPESVPDDRAVFAEPLAAALEIFEQTQVPEEVLVVGDGKLGLLIALAMKTKGVNVKLHGRHPERAERLAIPFLSEVKGNFPMVVEATGNSQGLLSSLSWTRPRGTLVLKSTFEKDFAFNPSLLVINEIQLLGSRCGPMDKAVRLLANLDPTPLIEQRFPLQQGVQAMEEAAKRGTLKIVLH